MFEPVVAGLHMVKVAYELYPEEFKWKVPPYEYVYDRNPFDVIAGTSSIREGIESGAAIEALVENWDDDLFAFQKVRAAHVLY
jgi:uncharacterized protein YbbC (DUF1343 family)